MTNNNVATDLPLVGVRVLDFSQGIAGPYCASILQQQGAEVIKVEPPGGDWARATSHVRDGFTAVVLAYNAGKPSLAVDASHAAGQAALRRMASGVDVVVQNFRPGVMDRLGLGYGALATSNPRLVYVSISGFGTQGELARRPATDNVLQAMSGMMFANRDAQGQPQKIGLYVADIAVAMYASQLACAALFACARSGRGRHVELSMLEACAAFQASAILDSRFAQGGPPPRTSTAPSGVFATQDGFISLATLDNAMFRRLSEVLGLPEWMEDARFGSNAARLQHAQVLNAQVAGLLVAQTSAAWQARLTHADILHAPVLDYPQLLANPELRTAMVFDEVHMPGVAEPFPRARHPGVSGPVQALQARRVGEDSVDVLTRCGFSAAEIGELVASGALRVASAG